MMETQHLVPLKPLDLGKIENFSDMLKAMSETAFAGRQLGEAADILVEMSLDQAYTKVLTLSGAMTVAKMGLIICDMIDKGLVDIVISTGAIMCHGLVESTGGVHFKCPGNVDDEELRKNFFDRVYDTLESEKNLDYVEKLVSHILNGLDTDVRLCSWQFFHVLGEYLDRNTDTSTRGILKSAYQKGVPVFTPAFTDSELGLDLALHNMKQVSQMRKITKIQDDYSKMAAILNEMEEVRMQGKSSLRIFDFNPMDDLYHYARMILGAKKLGIITVGGGVPANWARQVGPFLDIARLRLLDEDDKRAYMIDHSDHPCNKRFSRGIRICPDSEHLGGLSGCTFREAVSWGKVVPESKGGKYAEIRCDATAVLPFLIKGVLERLEKS